MSKLTALLSFSLALNVLAAAGCDAPIDHDDVGARSREIPVDDAFLIGHIEADGVDADEVQALALAAAEEEAGFTADPSLLPEQTLAAAPTDPLAGCNNGWWWKCCFYDAATCCANRIGDYYCEY